MNIERSKTILIAAGGDNRIESNESMGKVVWVHIA